MFPYACLPRLLLNLRGKHHVLSLSLSFLKTFTRFAIFNLFSLLRKVPSTHIIQMLWSLETARALNPSSFCLGGSRGHVESLWYMRSCICLCNTFTGLVTIQPYKHRLLVGPVAIVWTFIFTVCLHRAIRFYLSLVWVLCGAWTYQTSVYSIKKCKIEFTTLLDLFKSGLPSFIGSIKLKEVCLYHHYYDSYHQCTNATTTTAITATMLDPVALGYYLTKLWKCGTILKHEENKNHLH